LRSHVQIWSGSAGKGRRVFFFILPGYYSLCGADGRTYSALRRQKEALNLMSAPNNYSSLRAGKKLFIPHRTLRRWRHHFDLFGEVPASTWLRNRKGGTIRRKYSRLV
jgi:hypothetical protein